MWRGGDTENAVRHSEYHCLMNGTHDTDAYTHDPARDPRWRVDGMFDGTAPVSAVAGEFEFPEGFRGPLVYSDTARSAISGRVAEPCSR